MLVYSVIWRKRSDLYVMRPDGSQKRRLTIGAKRDGAARWCPDGRRIAFNRYTGDSAHIYVINADGTNLRALTHGGELDGGPSWSPDGRLIAFDRFYGGRGQSDLLVMTAAGRSQRKLTSTERAASPHLVHMIAQQLVQTRPGAGGALFMSACLPVSEFRRRVA